MDSKLIIDGLAKSYPGRPVFANISVEIEKGHRLVITGPNGSGKSTLIRILCGFVRPTKGKITLAIEGQEFQRIEIRPYVGLVSPDLVLYDELSAMENLRFFARVAGIQVTISELSGRLHAVGLEGRGDDMVASYSSGMQQRLKYCLALLRNPELLLLDEPTSNLDDMGKEMVDGVIRTHRGIVVIATNEKSDLEYGDQLIRLDR
jgi:heme exporter protein A